MKRVSKILNVNAINRLSLITLGWINLLVSTIHNTPLIERDFHPYTLPFFSSPTKNLPLKGTDPLFP